MSMSSSIAARLKQNPDNDSSMALSGQRSRATGGSEGEDHIVVVFAIDLPNEVSMHPRFEGTYLGVQKTEEKTGLGIYYGSGSNRNISFTTTYAVWATAGLGIAYVLQNMKDIPQVTIHANYLTTLQDQRKTLSNRDVPRTGVQRPYTELLRYVDRLISEFSESNRLVLTGELPDHDVVDKARDLAVKAAKTETSLPDWRLGLHSVLRPASSAARFESEDPAAHIPDNRSAQSSSPALSSGYRHSEEGRVDTPHWETVTSSSEDEVVDDSEPEREERRRGGMIPVQTGPPADMALVEVAGLGGDDTAHWETLTSSSEDEVVEDSEPEREERRRSDMIPVQTGPPADMALVEVVELSDEE
ncbi:hypothetical protein FRC07_006759 [Ceratobasidium sp. 392]|nr:hypothetical protein FRC07_006759 [Ceratobasidium sp. 392]